MKMLLQKGKGEMNKHIHIMPYDVFSEQNTISPNLNETQMQFYII